MRSTFQRLIFVRHGEAEHHARKLTGGSTDLPLTRLGRVQAERAAHRLKELLGETRIALYTSDLVRAVESGSFVAGVFGVAPTALAGLRELDNGVAAGLTLDVAERIERPQTEPILDWVPYDRAESWRAMSRRVYLCLDSLPRAADTVVIVGHGNSGGEVLNWWLGNDVDARLDFELAPASISELRLGAWREPRVVRINDTAHLADLRV
jgi:probable phosphoglycerate mutase